MAQYAADMYHVLNDPHVLRAFQGRVVTQTGGLSHDSAVRPAPRLEHDRWLVVCPCGGGAGVSTEGIAYCCDCGAVMTVADWPRAAIRSDVDQIFMSRAPKSRNWNPATETLDDLRAENLSHAPSTPA